MLNLAIAVGGPEIIIVLVVVLLLFGAKRIPEVGRSLGTGMREFKDSVTGKDRDEEDQEQLERPAKVDAAVEEQPAAAERTATGPAGAAGERSS